VGKECDWWTSSGKVFQFFGAEIRKAREPKEKLNGLGKGDEHHAYAPSEYYDIFTFTFKLTVGYFSSC